MEQIIELLEPYKIQDSWTKTARFYTDLVWYMYSILGCIPLFVITLYRFIHHPKNLDQYDAKNLPPRDRCTTIYKILASAGVYYYFIDLSITLIEGTYFEFCRWPFFYHHIIASPVMFLVNREDWVPWFIVVTPALHAILLAYPFYYPLNVIYVFSLIYVHYRLYFEKVYYKFPALNFTRWWYVTFYIAMAFLGYTDCKNELPFL